MQRSGVLRVATLLSLFIFLLSPQVIATTSVPLRWEGHVIALGGKQDSSHYQFKIENVTIDDRGDYYIVHETVSFRGCVLYKNGTPVRGCPVETKNVTFEVKRDTNTFMLDGKPAFFFQYWPGFSTNGSVYSSGIELRPHPVDLYLKNESPENHIGWSVSLQGGPIRILRCKGWSLPENTSDVPRCIEETYKNFTIDLTFRGPYLVDGGAYLPADPFGIIKDRAVVMFINLEDTPETREFLRNAKSISPPSNNSSGFYLLGGGLVALALVLAVKKRG